MRRYGVIVLAVAAAAALGLTQLWPILRQWRLATDPQTCTPLYSRHLVVRGARRVARIAGIRRPAPQRGEVPPRLISQALALREVARGLEGPTTMAILPGDGGLLVVEKATGRVRHIRGGTIAAPVLDLGVDSKGERGALGIVLHPRFQQNRYVYIYWTTRIVDPAAVPGADARDTEEQVERLNRVDRFVWTGSTLTFDRNILTLPSRAVALSASTERLTVHVGGVMSFGRDEKLFVVTGDQVLRGRLQNVGEGPPPTNENLTGIVLRLNDDGSVPPGNPFSAYGTEVGGEAGANLSRIFAYGIRNSFGMDVDPLTGELWITENGLNTFDEINRVPPGFNSGWVQIMGPDLCFAQYVALEQPHNPVYFGGNPAFRTEQLARTAAEARGRLVQLPNSVYVEPAFSWKYTVAPTALHFVRTDRLPGLERHRDVLVGDVRGQLYRFVLDEERKGFRFSDRRLLDKVDDDARDRTWPETGSLVIGREFGIISDIEMSPSGSIYVLSFSQGKLYEISPR